MSEYGYLDSEIGAGALAGFCREWGRMYEEILEAHDLLPESMRAAIIAAGADPVHGIDRARVAFMALHPDVARSHMQMMYATADVCDEVTARLVELEDENAELRRALRMLQVGAAAALGSVDRGEVLADQHGPHLGP